MSEDDKNITEDTKMVNSEVISAITLSLPQFNPESPDLWFAIAETDFSANRVTSDTQKYAQLLKALPYDVVERVQDIVRAPPPQDRYATIKSAILDRFCISRKKQLQKLLNERVGGDKKPSQMLREMKALAMNSVTEEVLHQLWTERLPARIRPLLIITESLGLDALAEMADRLVDSLEILPVMAVNNQYLPTNNNAALKIEQQLAEIHTTIRQMQKQLYEIGTQQQIKQQINDVNKYNPRHSRSRQRSRQRSQTPNHSDICYFHTKWGNNARKCIAPCKFLTLAPTTSGN